MKKWIHRPSQGEPRKHTGCMGTGRLWLFLHPGICPECVCPPRHSHRSLDRCDHKPEVCVCARHTQPVTTSYCAGAVQWGCWVFSSNCGSGFFSNAAQTTDKKDDLRLFHKKGLWDEYVKSWACLSKNSFDYITQTYRNNFHFLVVYFICTVINMDEQEVTPCKQIRKVISVSLTIGLQRSTLITSRCISC